MKPLNSILGTRVAMAIVVCLAWSLILLWIPATMIVERGFQRMAHAIFFPDFQLSPTHGSMPYEIVRFQSPKEVAPPFIVEVSDDSGQDFESIPLSPMDVSVLLDKMKEVGANRVVITSPLGWQEADPFALSALETASAAMERCLTTSAVTRAPVSEPMPPAFARASIPISQVRGNFRTLPMVNRLVINDTFLGNENTWAGFSQIESEVHSPQSEHLLARWDDRVIFSSSLLALCLRENIALTELQIEMGQAIFVPRTGHWWAIDEFGRYQLRNTEPLKPNLSAAELLRPEENVLTTLKKHTPPLHFVPHSGGEFGLLLNLSAAPMLLEKIQWKRLNIFAELALMALLSGLTAWITPQSRFKQIIIATAFIALFASSILGTSTWIPLSPLLLGLGVACCIPSFSHSKQAQLVTEAVKPRKSPVATKTQPKPPSQKKIAEATTPERKRETTPASRKKKSPRKRSKK